MTLPEPFDQPPEISPPALLDSRFESEEEDFLSFSEEDAAFFEKEDEKEPLIHAPDPVPTTRTFLYWLLSAALNIVVLILLGLIFFPERMKPIALDAIFSDRLGDQLETMTLDEGNINPTQAESYAVTIPEVGEINDFVVFDKPDREFIDDVNAPFFDQSRIDIADLLTGRTDPGTKNDLLSKYGGNKKTSEAVRLGLLWLKKQQLKGGNWSLKGPYRDGVSRAIADNPTAATGMALLAFQGDGNTRFQGDHKTVVRNGWKWLVKQQADNGSFFDSGNSSSRFYTQAICTIALCELIAMEGRSGKGADLRGNAQKAVDYLVQRQNPKLGGWRYDVETAEKWINEGKTGRKREIFETAVDSDLSVTGWVLMALESARVANLFVPQTTFDKVSDFLDSVSADDGAKYYYRKEEKSLRASMTATGLLCREYLGWDRKNPTLLRGAATLVEPENLIHYPDKDSQKRGSQAEYINVYGWYSASMTLKHLGPYHPLWRQWNDALNSAMPENQEPAGSEEAGSWDPSQDAYFFGGGRLYVTSLSILCLEVYYRHLSLYLNP